MRLVRVGVFVLQVWIFWVDCVFVLVFGLESAFVSFKVSFFFSFFF